MTAHASQGLAESCSDPPEYLPRSSPPICPGASYRLIRTASPTDSQRSAAPPSSYVLVQQLDPAPLRHPDPVRIPSGTSPRHSDESHISLRPTRRAPVRTSPICPGILLAPPLARARHHPSSLLARMGSPSPSSLRTAHTATPSRAAHIPYTRCGTLHRLLATIHVASTLSYIRSAA